MFPIDSKTWRDFDWPLALIPIALVGMGSVFIYSSQPTEPFWRKQLTWLGISVVADFEFVPHPNLRALEIQDCAIKTQYSIAYHRDRAHSPMIKAFLETVRRMKTGRDAAAGRTVMRAGREPKGDIAHACALSQRHVALRPKGAGVPRRKGALLGKPPSRAARR